MIHVSFSLHDKTGRYSKFTGTAMLSLLENTTSPVTVHILHDNTLTADNRDKFSYIAGQYHQRVKFYNVETLCADKIAEYNRSIPSIKTLPFTIGAMYRLFLAQIFPEDIEKIIYLDSDLIINLDINEMWRIELGEKILAAVTESSNSVNTQNNLSLCREGLVKADDYFNSGVLIMNLELLRANEDSIYRAIKFVSENPRFAANPDQDMLNYIFATQTLKLPIKFNTFVRDARRRSEKKIARKIYHYLSGAYGQGLLLDTGDAFNRLWMSYFVRTPFFDADTIGRLYAGFRNMHVGFKNSLAQVSAMVSGKTRAFFAVPGDFNTIRQIFYIRPDEEIIAADNQASFQKLLNIMHVSRGKKIFFIVVRNFPFQILAQAGFVAGKDFVNGLDFMSEAHGVPLNSHALIQAM
ncbi:MAG: glycosyltransferase family 8 protein [Quinella sp. 1Q7]|nr:glycosyltransferase family 8 protein [Quinella sp. 1Q7]